MKKFLLVFAIILIALIMLTSCSMNFHCPTYSHHNKKTSHGSKAQAKYYKHSKKNLHAILTRR